MKKKFITSIGIASSMGLFLIGPGEVIVDAQGPEITEEKTVPGSYVNVEFKSLEEFLRSAGSMKDKHKEKFSRPYIAYRKYEAYEKMKKKVTERVTLNGKEGQSVTFKWRDIKIDSSYLKEHLESSKYGVTYHESAEADIATFGNQKYAVDKEEAYNNDRSLKLTCKSSIEDPFGVDLTFTVLKEQNQYSTKFSFSNTSSQCEAKYKLITRPNDIDGKGNFEIPADSFDVDFDSFIKVQPRELRLEANDLTISQGEKFDPFDKRIGLKAIDTFDGDITKQIKVVSNEVNPLIAGAYRVKYQVTNSVGTVATKTITVTVKAHDPWPNGNVDGWKMFSGKDIQLIHDPQNSVLDSGKTFYADEHASIYKIFNGKDSLKEGKQYRVTVYVKPLVGDDLVNHLVKVSLKADPSSPGKRPLINTALSNGTKTIKGYYVLTNTFKVEKGESTPLINVENFKAGYIGSIAIQQIN